MRVILAANTIWVLYLILSEKWKIWTTHILRLASRLHRPSQLITINTELAAHHKVHKPAVRDTSVILFAKSGRTYRESNIIRPISSHIVR